MFVQDITEEGDEVSIKDNPISFLASSLGNL
jgi:hypothetical protein